MLAKYGGPIELLNDFTGANFNRVDSSGNTALHWACANAHYEMARALLDTKKCDLKIRDKIYGGNTALTIILAQGYESADSDGSPLSVSYKMLVTKMVELDPKLVDVPHFRTGLYPVELALCRRDMDMVQVLTTDQIPIERLATFTSMTYYQSRLILRSCFDATPALQRAWEWLPAWRNGPYENANREVEHYIRTQTTRRSKPNGT